MVGSPDSSSSRRRRRRRQLVEETDAWTALLYRREGTAECFKNIPSRLCKWPAGMAPVFVFGWAAENVEGNSRNLAGLALFDSVESLHNAISSASHRRRLQNVIKSRHRRRFMVSSLHDDTIHMSAVARARLACCVRCERDGRVVDLKGEYEVVLG